MKNNRNLFSELGLTEADDSNIAELNIDADKVKRKTSAILKSDKQERVIIMKRKRIKAIMAAAAICAITVTTVFASETIRERIGNIISYFHNMNKKDCTYFTYVNPFCAFMLLSNTKRADYSFS